VIRCDGGEYRLIERPIDPPLEPHLPPLQRTLPQAIDFANPFMTEEKPASVLVGRILDWSAVVCVCLCRLRSIRIRIHIPYTIGLTSEVAS
jgi:hypothetical protein